MWEGLPRAAPCVTGPTGDAQQRAVLLPGVINGTKIKSVPRETGVDFGATQPCALTPTPLCPTQRDAGPQEGSRGRLRTPDARSSQMGESGCGAEACGFQVKCGQYACGPCEGTGEEGPRI